MKEKIKSLWKNEVYRILIITVGVVFFSIIVINGFNAINPNNAKVKVKSPKKISHNNILAYNVSMDFVKDRLKSPSTAKFPSSSEKNQHTKYLGNDAYEIVSWVDSQNAFGAMIRTKFRCEIKFVYEKVQLIDIEFFE